MFEAWREAYDHETSIMFVKWFIQMSEDIPVA